MTIDLQPEHPAPDSKAPVPETPAVPGGDPPADVQSRIDRSANWFFWIAALSVINSLATHFGSSYGFVVGLGITQVLDVVVAGLVEGGAPFALAVDVLVAAAFVGIGLLARKNFAMAFWGGMLVYAADALIFAVVQDWIAVGFHAFVLFSIYMGYRGLRDWRGYPV